MGPTGFLGLNAALKQRLVLKHESLRPVMSQGLLKMLILLGLKEDLAVTVATPLDLKTKRNLKLLPVRPNLSITDPFTELCKSYCDG